MQLETLFAPTLPRWQQTIRERCRNSGGPQLAFDAAELEETISARFRRVVDLVPNRLAVCFEGRCVTYRELEMDANRIAHAIVRLNPPRDVPIAVLLKPSIELVSALLGILHAGRAYVALDPRSPSVHLEKILAYTRSQLLMTEEANADTAAPLIGSGRRAFFIDTVDRTTDAESLAITTSADDAAAIFFTSGTTGKSKGIVRDHRNILRTLYNHNHTAGLSIEDRASSMAQACFSSSLSQIFGVLLAGASLYPTDVNWKDFGDLADWIGDSRITVLSAPIALFRRLTNSVDISERARSVRLVRLYGDFVYRADVQRFKRSFSPDCILVSRWGQTEAPNCTTFMIDQTTQFDDDVVPAGYPNEDRQILLISKEGAWVDGAGLPGEVAVRSRSLPPGYWEQPELTAEKYLLDPIDGDKRICMTGDWGRFREDGCLELLGRRDRLVKIRGYRVELGAVEAALLNLADVSEAAIRVDRTDTGDQRLVAYIVPTRDSPFSPSSLRRVLAQRLPDFMIPSVFMSLPILPMASSGKIDRRALPPCRRERPNLEAAFVAPRTPIEREVAELWSNLLDLSEIGVNDPFLDLGGDSLRAAQLSAQVMRRFRISLSWKVLRETNTITKMSDAIGEGLANSTPPDKIERLLLDIERGGAA